MKLLIKISSVLILFVLPMHSQTFNNVSEPVVIYYGCDHSSLTADTTAPEADSALNTASYYIYRLIIQDSLTQHVIFIAPESADTAAADTARNIFTAPVDSMTQSGRGSGYWIGSTITGNMGNYTLTVYIKDAYTKTVFTKGEATFSSFMPADIKRACNTAAVQILPIITKIQDYQKQIRSQNPSLSIDPQISITTSNSNLNYNESTNVIVTAED